MKTKITKNLKIYRLLNRKPFREATQRDEESETENNKDVDEEDPEDSASLEKRKRPVIPPPFPLLPKSQLPSEPVRTGAPIPFLKLTYAKGGSNLLLEKQWTTDKVNEVKELEQASYSRGRRNFKAMFSQELRSWEDNPIVYSRYNKSQYDPDEKIPEEPWSSWIINIKKLIAEMEVVNKTLLGSIALNKAKSNAKSKLVSYYEPYDENDKTLVFESRFESGNLNLAIKLSDKEYNLFLQNDINTNGHTQWYFFRVSNTFKGHTVKFNIVNLAKPDSLYNYGMKVMCFSERRKMNEGVEWYRDGTDISYYKNNFKREGKFGSDKFYYTFTYTFKFPYNKDTLYFAYSLPYTYTDLCDDLTKMVSDKRIGTFTSRNTLWRTLAGNKWEYLTITSRENKPEDDPNRIKKRGVVISARVHPGESVGSWMMKGVIDFLVSDTIEAKALRKLFIFKVIPMLNPDGVINGNYRWSLSGGDLNRRWKAPSRVLHPTVYETKKLWKEFQKEREVTLFCDLHGHSRRKNIFMYGNTMPDDPSSTRIFPFIMSKLVDYFSFKYSRFSMTKSKETTARISLYRELGIPWIYTMEASFWGADQGELENMHFNAEHFKHIGRQLFHALILYCKIDPYEIVTGKKQSLDAKQEKKEEVKEHDFNFDNIINEFKENEDELIIESEAGSSAGSDSEPSEDNMSDAEIAKILPVKPKKKKQKKLVSQNSLKKRQREFELKLKEKNKKREEAEKAKKSPFKRVSNYKNALKDRFNLSRINKVEMVDAWTQTSNQGSDNENEEKKDKVPLEEPKPLKHIKNADHSFYSTKLDDSPISLYKRNNPNQKYKINMNSSLSTNKTFRSPIANSISNDYKKKEYNTSFTLSKSKGKLYKPTDLEDTESMHHYRHNSSNIDNMGDRYNFAQRQIRRSPQKSIYNPPGSSNSNSLL